MRSKPIVALIYDFDGTLSPGNMQEFGFIQAIGKKPQEFWQESDDIAVGQDASNILSYMKLMFDEARKAGIKLRKEDFEKILSGVELSDGVIAADELEYIEADDHRKLGIEIHSGKNRIVRRIFESLGYEVKALDRVSFAGLTKKGIKRGDWRYLTEGEINLLRMGAYI